MSVQNGVQLFRVVCEKISKGELSVEEALAEIKDIDFLQFSIDDIKLVQDAKWLPDKETVSILRSWMRHQDQVLLEMRAYLVLTPSIGKDRLIEFIESIKTPSLKTNMGIQNIFYTIATAGGTRSFINPAEYGLVTVDAIPKISDAKKLFSLFSQDPNDFLSTSPQQNTSFTVGLPPFLKVQVESYTLGTPAQPGNKKGGLQGWLLQGSNDPNVFTKTIDQVNGDKQLEDEKKLATYSVSNPNAGFFRYIRLTSTSQNHLGNLQIIARGFDVSGLLIIAKE